MYTNRYSNSINGYFNHSPYYMPNFNYTYFNSPSHDINTQKKITDNFSPITKTNEENYTKKFYLENSNINSSKNINQDTKSFYKDSFFRMSGNTISIFGFNIQIDDLIILGVLIFLIYEKCDDLYLIILLGLLFFDIKLDFWR